MPWKEVLGEGSEQGLHMDGRFEAQGCAGPEGSTAGPDLDLQEDCKPGLEAVLGSPHLDQATQRV